MLKANVVSIPLHLQGSGFDEAIFNKTNELCELLARSVEASLAKIKEAERAAVERLEQYFPQERLLTLKEAAAYLHYKPRTIDSYTSPSKPPLITFTMIGGEKRFKRLWLDQAIEQGAVKARVVRPL